MVREGEISPSLARWQGYFLYARSLERCKKPRAACKAQEARRLDIISRICEERLDAAFDELQEIEDRSGDRAAELVCRHYLWLQDWHTVTADMGIPYDLGKKIAYRALKSLDSD